MAKRTHIDDLVGKHSLPELSDEEASWVHGGLFRRLEDPDGTQTTIDTIYPDRPSTDDLRPDCPDY